MEKNALNFLCDKMCVRLRDPFRPVVVSLGNSVLLIQEAKNYGSVGMSVKKVIKQVIGMARCPNSGT